MKTGINIDLALILSVFLSTVASAQTAANTHALLDEWWTPGFNARVKLAACDDKLCGTIVWAWDDQPSGAADKRPLVGQRIISGMKLEAKNADKAGDKAVDKASDKAPSYAGSIYNPEDGNTYKATMRLKTPNTLVVAGCVLFICQEQIWRRHDSLRSPPVSPIQ
jgi:uncharacterized protein (DUF2147 family)